MAYENYNKLRLQCVDSMKKVADLCSLVHLFSYGYEDTWRAKNSIGVFYKVFHEDEFYSDYSESEFFQRVLSNIMSMLRCTELYDKSEWDFVKLYCLPIASYCSSTQKKILIDCLFAISNYNKKDEVEQFIRLIASYIDVPDAYCDEILNRYIKHGKPKLWNILENKRFTVFSERIIYTFFAYIILLAILLITKNPEFILVLTLAFGYFVPLLYAFSCPDNISTIESQVKAKQKQLSEDILSLFVLVARKDGEVLDQEIQVVKEYCKKYFWHTPEYMERLFSAKIETKLKSFRTYCSSINKLGLAYDEKLSLLDKLFKISYSDGNIIPMELDYLRQIARFLHISKLDLNEVEVRYGVDEETQRRRAQQAYLNNIYIHSKEHSLKVLGLKSNATSGEIKRAYRRLALQFHPDKLPLNATEHQKADAAEKFRQVNEAYNCLCGS